MKTEKDFDCVKMMRDIRDKITAEIILMDTKQVLEYFRLKAEEFESRYGKPLAMASDNKLGEENE
jgi:hypothetical protein